VTRCTDWCEIWRGGVDHAKFHPYWCRARGVGPSKLIILPKFWHIKPRRGVSLRVFLLIPFSVPSLPFPSSLPFPALSRPPFPSHFPFFVPPFPFLPSSSSLPSLLPYFPFPALSHSTVLSFPYAFLPFLQ